MIKDDKNLVPANDKAETALDIASFVSSAVPWIGGPVSNVLGGISYGRKLARIKEALEGLASDLKEFKSDVSESYVKTEDFEELLERTLRSVADERNDEKRQIYRSFLTNAIENPGETFDEQIRFLRTLNDVQPNHFRILNALNQTPDPNPGMMGSPMQTLTERLGESTDIDIEESISQLNDMRITNMSSLKTMMTGHGASDLRHFITPYGQRFLQYIVK